MTFKLTGIRQNLTDPFINYSYRHESTSLDRSDYQDLISFETQQTISLIMYVIFSSIFGVLGVCTNIINIIIFTRMRFQDSINISFLGLSISDLLGAMVVLISSVCKNPLMQQTFPSVNMLLLDYVIAANPRIVFNKITTFITAFMTFERCLCIAMPLKVKAIMTKSRTKTIIVSIYISTLVILCSPFYYVTRLTWTFLPSKNSSMLMLTFSSDRELVKTIAFYVQSLALTLTSMLFVIVCTVVLIVKLNNKAKWRHLSLDKSQAESMSSKDKQVIKMVVVLSTIFIICFTPEVLLFLAMAIEDELILDGKYANTFLVIWAIPWVLFAINSSLNIFVYFKMSSRYRNNFLRTFLKSV